MIYGAVNQYLSVGSGAFDFRKVNRAVTINHAADDVSQIFWPNRIANMAYHVRSRTILTIQSWPLGRFAPTAPTPAIIKLNTVLSL